MLEAMSPQQFDEWIAFHELEAWGDEHRETAKLMATVLNSQGGRKDGKAFEADDFLPKPRRFVDQDTEDKLHAAHWVAWAKRRGGINKNAPPPVSVRSE